MIGPAMDSSLSMNHSMEKQNGTCGCFEPLTETHPHCFSRSLMNVRQVSHLTENTWLTLRINLARLRCMFRRFPFLAVNGGSQPTSEHNRDGVVMVANFSISALTRSLWWWTLSSRLRSKWVYRNHFSKLAFLR